MCPIWTHIFSDGLVQPPTRFGIFCLQLVDFLCKRNDGFLVFRLDCLESIGYTFSVLRATILTRRRGQPQSNQWHLLYSRTVVCQFCHYWGGSWVSNAWQKMNCTSWWFLLREAMRESATKNSTVVVGRPTYLGAMWWTTFANKNLVGAQFFMNFRDGNPKESNFPPGAPRANRYKWSEITPINGQKYIGNWGEISPYLIGVVSLHLSLVGAHLVHFKPYKTQKVKGPKFGWVVRWM